MCEEKGVVILTLQLKSFFLLFRSAQDSHSRYIHVYIMQIKFFLIVLWGDENRTLSFFLNFNTLFVKDGVCTTGYWTYAVNSTFTTTSMYTNGGSLS